MSVQVFFMAEELGLKVAGLYAGGSSFGAIGKELEISKSRVGGLLREGIEGLQNNHVEAPVQIIPEVLNASENEQPLLPIITDSQDFEKAWMETILIQATPIMKKVALNSKVFLQHEYFVKFLGYEGDIGDLLIEALNFYWKEMGFSIKITHNSVM